MDSRMIFTTVETGACDYHDIRVHSISGVYSSCSSPSAAREKANNESPVIEYEASIINHYRKIEDIRYKKHETGGDPNEGENGTQIRKFIVLCARYCEMNFRVTSLAVAIYNNVRREIELSASNGRHLGAACLFIANKMEGEEIYDVCAKIAEYAGDARVEDLVRMELVVLRALRYNVYFVTPLMCVNILKREKQFMVCYEFSAEVEETTEAILNAILLSEKCEGIQSCRLARSALVIARNSFGEAIVDEDADVCNDVKEAIVEWSDFLLGLYPLTHIKV